LVWLGCRDATLGAAAAQALSDDGDVRYVALDVTREASVAAAARVIEREVGHLDVLVNNAGVAPKVGEGAVSQIDLDALRAAHEVNFYGATRVAQHFLPLLRSAPAARIVNMSSNVGSLDELCKQDSYLRQAPMFAYASSKTALNALTGWLAAELAGTSIKVNSVCPGYTATALNDFAGPQAPEASARIVVHAATLAEDGPSGTFFDVGGPVSW
jgi:NAD(P)-dependent dehydrogenase (short-subunit alcohol dehydrogenase family)